jgi:hypothetical protein
VVPHTGHLPCKAGRPFFIVTCLASFIARFALHFTQYASGFASATVVLLCPYSRCRQLSVWPSNRAHGGDLNSTWLSCRDSSSQHNRVQPRPLPSEYSEEWSTTHNSQGIEAHNDVLGPQTPPRVASVRDIGTV